MTAGSLLEDDMLTYLVDDRGGRGEYAHFLDAHSDRLPRLDLAVFSCWRQLEGALRESRPALVLLDMHFDEGEVEDLFGDVEKLAASARFAGDHARAEAQLRKLQGAFIVQGLRERSLFVGPIILFGSLPKQQAERMKAEFGPLSIVEGLIYDEVRQALLWATELTEDL